MKLAGHAEILKRITDFAEDLVASSCDRMSSRFVSADTCWAFAIAQLRIYVCAEAYSPRQNRYANVHQNLAKANSSGFIAVSGGQP